MVGYDAKTPVCGKRVTESVVSDQERTRNLGKPKSSQQIVRGGACRQYVTMYSLSTPHSESEEGCKRQQYLT